MQKESIEILDVIIVGAGISGISAAYHIQTKCKNKSYAILEGRDSLGGTWDLFKYPGIRSDSDMQTLGFSFYPWKNPKAIADGPSILAYVKETASHFGIDKHIRFNHRVSVADWSVEDALWTVQIPAAEGVVEQTIKTRFLFMCSGYYDYSGGYSPTFPQSDTFKGQIIHPQKWDTNLDYTDKKIVIIGSGATAVTLVPELAKKAAHVTMLQRSPTYVFTRPTEDSIANFLRKIMPEKWAYGITRWKNILLAIFFYEMCQKQPELMKKWFHRGIQKILGTDFDLKPFTPRYNPWDQRVCLVPDGDLFKALKNEKASIVTDEIERFTPDGILLKSGKELSADIIVSATGLVMQYFGGMKLLLNGKEMVSNERYVYRGVLLSDIPNFAVAMGYTNASWTLKCDLSGMYVARILNYMDKNKKTVCTPIFDAKNFSDERLLDFDAGYVQRAESWLPKQGSASPWKVYQNYIKDTFSLKFSKVNDGYLQYK